MNKKRRYTAAALAALLSVSLCAQDNSKPWTFWYWMYGAVSKAGIHADLQGMKDVGLGGCYLMPIRGVDERPQFGGTAHQLTPAFWQMVDYSLQQADSLGLDMGIHICDGFALAGNPSIRPEESMQKVVWTDSVFAGGKLQGMLLQRPEAYQGYYQDIAVFAIRCKECPQLFKPAETICSDEVSTKKGYYLTSKPATITYRFAAPITVRSMRVVPNGNNIQSQRLLVQASDDGIHYRDIKQLVPPRQGWQNTACAYTFSLPTTTARYFRFAWTPVGTEPGAEDMDAAKWKPLLKLDDITLSNQPLINQYEGKSAAVWRIDTDPIESETVSMSDVVRLQMDGDRVTGAWIDGKLTKKLPKGTWRLLRMGHTSTGQTNATAGGGKGLEIDKFSALAVKKLFDSWYALFLQRPHAEVVKYLHIDSWECGSQNWGHRFAEEFRARRGYDLVPYLPVMAGVPLESTEKYEQVLKDIRLTVDDLVHDVFFKTFTDLAHQHGKKVSHESIAPTFPADGLRHYQYSDHPMGEYWLNSPTHDKPNDMLDAISGAHIYGKNIVQAEGFTEVRGVWDETPAMLKPLLDRNLALGMNKLFFHVTAHNPWLDRKPGMTLDGIGLFFQRDNTWYAESKGFVDYITRCQNLLQQGQPVVDIAVFTGEEIPSRSLTPDKLVPMLPGIFGPERVASEQKRMANEGLPMEESPVGVTHSANILDLKDWCNALHGYKYDSMNKDALLHQPFRYKVLVVPQKELSAEVKEKIEALRQAGVIIIDQPYKAKDFSKYGIAPDVLLPDSMDYAHRQVGEGSVQKDIYFLTNQQGSARTLTASFRTKEAACVKVTDAVSGKVISRQLTKNGEGRAEVSFPLPAYGSAFVELSNSLQEQPTEKAIAAQTYEQTIGGMWRITFDRIDACHVAPLPYDWSQSDDEKVRYYSGTVSFHNTITWKPSKKAAPANDYVTLSLGRVADVAHVYVNDVDCGCAWTAPYEVQIPLSLLKKGQNQLRIDVVNTWHNALQGADEDKAPYEGIWTNAKYRTKSKALLPAGLLGGVTLKY